MNAMMKYPPTNHRRLGRLRAITRALTQDLGAVLEVVPGEVEHALRRVCERDVRRAHELLKEGV